MFAVAPPEYICDPAGAPYPPFNIGQNITLGRGGYTCNSRQNEQAKMERARYRMSEMKTLPVPVGSSLEGKNRTKRRKAEKAKRVGW